MSTQLHPAIALLSPQSNRNLGDTATFAAAIAAYRRRLPGVELVAVVPDPADSAALLGVSGFPLYGNGDYVPAQAATTRRTPDAGKTRNMTRLASMRRVFAFTGRLDAIVFTGGGQLDDFWGGPWSLPFWMLTWIAAARARGVKVLFHAIGYDRLSSRTSRSMALAGLRLAHYRSFRDAQSLELMQAMGLRAGCDVLPDLAFALYPWADAAGGAPAGERPFAVVNPVSMRMWSQQRDESYSAYLDAFLVACRRLLDRGFHVKLASTQDKMDDDALTFVADALAAEGRSNWERVHVTRLEEFLQIAGRARLVVSSRLHGLILSLVAGTPVVSVAPMRKMSRLMIEFGLADFDVSMTGLQADALVAMIERALGDETALRRRIRATAGEYRRRLDQNFDHLASSGLLGERAQRQFQLETSSA